MSTRQIAPTFRIMREVRTRAGVRLADVDHPLMPGCSLSLHAPDADAAIANAKAIVRDTRNLIAVPTEN